MILQWLFISHDIMPAICNRKQLSAIVSNRQQLSSIVGNYKQLSESVSNLPSSVGHGSQWRFVTNRDIPGLVRMDRIRCQHFKCLPFAWLHFEFCCWHIRYRIGHIGVEIISGDLKGMSDFLILIQSFLENQMKIYLSCIQKKAQFKKLNFTRLNW